ncbi:hypothetical protein ACI3KS_13720 [Microbacterium sp. ZW T5_45]|uniref:hypothetical protein n=1 Tax=Microbacterium sp. ZW T5_45 TaxID=3378080 RepID=UPI0038551C12
MNADARRARTAYIWVGVIAPLVILLLSAVVVAAWLPSIPEPAAIHWGPGGVDGFGPGWTYLVIGLGLGGAIILISAFSVFAGERPRRSRPVAAEARGWSATSRFIGATMLGLSVMLALLSLLGVGVQRGLADAADAPDITPWVLLGLALMAGVAALGWFLQPDGRVASGEGTSPAPLALADSERAVWMGTVSTATGGRIVLGISVFVMFGLTVVLAATGSSVWWLTGVLAIVLALLTATMLVFRVRVTADGLQVRSVAGWPRFTIPADRVASVSVVDVNPFAEFGGWGYRIGTDGRRGVVLRSGEALQVAQRNGKVFVVTVDDARSAASLLAASADSAGGAA